MNTTRRCFIAGSLAASASPRYLRAQAARAPSDAEILAGVAPELREAASRLLIAGHPPLLTMQSLPALRAKAAAAVQPFLAAPAVETKSVAVRGRDPVTVYVVNAKPGTARPAIVHFHGGGFVLNSARKEIPRLQRLALMLDCVIVSVEYSLAPEAAFRVSTEQNYAALKWTHDQAAALGVDRARIAVMGESAGGGHAAILAFAARDRGEVRLALQMLVYPMLDDRTVSTAGLPPYVGALVWTAQANRFGWTSFLGNAGAAARRADCPVPARRADLAGLAPAFIGVGSIDLFAGEDVEYARRLIRAGVPTELLVVPGAFHGFDVAAPATSIAEQFAAAKMRAFARAFAAP